MSADFAQIELARKDIVAMLGAKLIRLITMQAARSRRALMHKDGHEVRRRPFVVGIVDRVVIFPVDAAVNGVNEAVTKTRGGPDEKRRRKDSFAAGREHAIDWIVHAAGHYRLDAAAIRPRAEDVRSASGERLATRQ